MASKLNNGFITVEEIEREIEREIEQANRLDIAWNARFPRLNLLMKRIDKEPLQMLDLNKIIDRYCIKNQQSSDSFQFNASELPQSLNYLIKRSLPPISLNDWALKTCPSNSHSPIQLFSALPSEIFYSNMNRLFGDLQMQHKQSVVPYCPSDDEVRYLIRLSQFEQLLL